MPRADDGLSDALYPAETPRKRKRAEHARPRVTGVFHRTQKGFGFVRPLPADGEGAKQPKNDDARGRHLHPGQVHARCRKRRCRGDRSQAARASGTGARPGPRGRVVEVIERQTRQFVGIKTSGLLIWVKF